MQFHPCLPFSFQALAAENERLENLIEAEAEGLGAATPYYGDALSQGLSGMEREECMEDDYPDLPNDGINVNTEVEDVSYLNGNGVGSFG